MSKNKIKLTDWELNECCVGKRYTRRDMNGKIIITLDENRNSFNKTTAYSVVLNRTGNWNFFNKRDMYIVDAIIDKDLAFLVADIWLKRNGYDYE